MSFEGSQFGQYRLQHLLGSGGMGEVYLGEDPRISQQVAIKVSRAEVSPYPNHANAQEAARLFQREAKAIARLDHPYILPLFGYGEEEVNGLPCTYLVMPFRREGSLTDWLRARTFQGLLSPQEVAALIAQAASALQYAHEHQIIHQDVKPSNFLIRSSREHPELPDLLLADFGIARMSNASSSISQSVRGTSTYMAPEQWSGNPLPATDQYALAVMAYELLTGRAPFTGRQEQVMFQHLQVAPQPPSTLNPRISTDGDRVILRALAKQASERFSSIEEFGLALQHALQPTPVVPAAPMPVSEDVVIRATLSISQIEAQQGTTRTLTLPGGRKLAVSVPAGTPDGHILYPNGRTPDNQGEILTLTISVTQPAADTPNPGGLPPTVYAANGRAHEQVTPTSSPLITSQTEQFTSVNLAKVGRSRKRNTRKIMLLVALVVGLIVSGAIGFGVYQSHTVALSNSSNTDAQNSQPGPNGAPANNASFKISFSVGGQDDSGIVSPTNPAVVQITSGQVCGPLDDGQPHTYTSYSDSNFTHTTTTSCSGNYANGKLTYTQTILQSSFTGGNLGTCTESSSSPITRTMEGTFTSSTSISGTWTFASQGSSESCTDGTTRTYPADTGTGNWVGTLVS